MKAIPKIQTAKLCSPLINGHQARSHHLDAGMCRLTWLKEAASSSPAVTVAQEGTASLAVVEILCLLCCESVSLAPLVPPMLVLFHVVWQCAEKRSIQSRLWTWVKYGESLSCISNVHPELFGWITGLSRWMNGCIMDGRWAERWMKAEMDTWMDIWVGKWRHG